MRVLHTASASTPSSGILTQMKWEQEAARRLALRWDTRVFGLRRELVAPDDAWIAAAARRRETRPFLRQLLDWIGVVTSHYECLLRIQDDYDVILLRYSFHDPFQWLFVKRARLPVYLVHHTLEAAELSSLGGAKGRLQALAEELIGPHTLGLAHGTIGVTAEILDHEKSRMRPGACKRAIYPNGVVYGGALAEDQRSSVTELLFAATDFYQWHGLDRLLSSLRATDEDLVLHLVGHVEKRDLEPAKADSRVRVHGHLSSDEIRALAARCALGLSSFALDRKGMKEACTLKVREYLMMGLPVYTGHRDVFPDAFPHYKMGPTDLGHILAFAREQSGVSRQTVSEAARPFIDKELLLSELAETLQQHLASDC